MPKLDPVSISSETHGLAGNLALPDQASAEHKVPAALIVGGPGPTPLQRYTAQGARQWPVLWSESLSEAGVGALCYDQRGSGLSSGQYHDADWDALYEDAKAVQEVLDVQPEVGGVAAIAWADGCNFALQLAAEGRVDALVLMAPAYHTAEQRYAAGIRELAARKGLSERVVQLRINQWRSEMEATISQVQQGVVTTTTDIGGQQVTTNLVRFLQTIAFNPAAVVPHVKVPVLLLHGEDDLVVPPSESAAMAGALNGPVERVTYPGVAHFLYRHPQAIKDAAAWLSRALVRE